MVTKLLTYSRQLSQENFNPREMLKCVEWVNRIYLEQGKVMFIFIKYKNMKSENGILVTWTQFLVNSSWVSWNITPSVQQFK